MSRRRIALLLAALLLVGAATVGGYALGSTAAPDARDAAFEAKSSARTAFYASWVEASVGEVSRGRRAGATVGERQGRKLGNRRGTLAAAKAVAPEGEAEPAASESLDLEGSGEVLVIGDSLEVLTSPYLEQYLPSVPLTINAEGGYNSYQLFDLFQESYDPAHSVIVFDAGTNDNPNYPEILAGNLETVSEIVGDRCMVVPTIHGLSVDGVDSTGKNRVVRSFAASRPGTEIPDWANAVPRIRS